MAVLPHEHLLEVIDLALRDKPKLANHISVWLDRWQTRQDLKRVLAHMDVAQAIPYFEDRVGNVVMDAEQMFEFSVWHEDEDEDDDYNSWGDPIYSSDAWHCQEGISHVTNWCETLRETVSDETAIAVVAGLAFTLFRVSRWTRQYPPEAVRKLSEASYVCSKMLDDAMRGLQGAIVRNPKVHQSYLSFTNWIAGRCKNMGYLMDWTGALFACILDGSHLIQFYEKLRLNNPDFLLSEELLDATVDTGPTKHNAYGRYLVDWWTRLCLLHRLAEEAEKVVSLSASAKGPVTQTSTIQSLANYFVGHGDRRKAAYYTSLAVRLNPNANLKDHEWVAEMYKSIQMMPESLLDRELAFLSLPSWERFERWMRDVSSVQEHRSKVKEWANVIASKGQICLAARMLWNVGLPEDAWNVVSQKRIAAYMIEENLVAFLKSYETYNSARAISVYQQMADSFIRDRHRSAYREATRWLRAVRDAWIGANQPDAWRRYIAELRDEYKRLPALQDELQKAGLA